MSLKYGLASVEKKFEKLSINYESQFSVDSGMSSCPSTPSTPTSPPVDFEIRPCREEDRPLIQDFLTTFFFRDEPLNKSSRLVVDGEPIPPELKEFSMEDMGNGVSLVVMHRDKLVGVSLNKLTERDQEHGEASEQIKNDKFRKIVRLLEYVEEQSKVFERFPDAKRAMMVHVVSVDTTYRGKGIAKALMARTRELAIENGCGFMSVDCTSHFTAMALKKLGFELHYSLDYSDYKPNGEVVFNPEPPHKAVTVYIQKL